MVKGASPEQLSVINEQVAKAEELGVSVKLFLEGSSFPMEVALLGPSASSEKRPKRKGRPPDPIRPPRLVGKGAAAQETAAPPAVCFFSLRAHLLSG